MKSFIFKIQIVALSLSLLSTTGVNVLAQSYYDTGTTYPTYDTGTTYSTYDTGTTYPTYDTGTTYPTYNTGTTYPVYNTGTTYPTYDTGTTYPTYNTGTTYPTYDTGTTYPTYNTGTTYPTYDTGTTYPTYNTGTTYPTYDTGTTYPVYQTPTYTYTTPTYTTPTYTYTTPTYTTPTYTYTTPTYTTPTYQTPTYCSNGSVIYSGSCPTVVVQTKQCLDGTTVNISDTCYKTCSNNVRLPEGQTCPTYCADGTQAVNGICYQVCANGDRISTTQSCPTPTKQCADGSIIPTTQTCPNKTCSNGTIVPVNGVCYKNCSNGTTVPETQVCYKSCPNGQSVPETNLCPAQTQTCWDGSVISVTQACPSQFKVCSNGTSVPVNQTCTRVCNGSVIPDTQVCYKTCPNNITVLESQSCPVVQGTPWVDLRIDRATTVFGGQAMLSWTSQNVSSCTASNGWGGPRGLSGTETRSNINVSTTYTITCYNQSGQSVTDSVNVSTLNQTIKVNNVVTSIPTQITDTSARCNGIGLIANNAQSNAWFEYGETPSLGRTTATAYIGTAPTSPFSNQLTNLKANTSYYCRAVMTNANGTVKGDIVKFTTVGKKVTYVKPTQTTTKTTTVVKKPTKQEIICSDGSITTVNSSSTAQVYAQGNKLAVMQIEKIDGSLAPSEEATYRLSYKNIADSDLKEVVFKIVLPQDFDLLSATAGAYDKEARTITVPMLSLASHAEGSISWKVRVAKNAQIGKAIVTTGYISYTVPGTEGKNPVQDEVTAYIIGSIMPGSTDAPAVATSSEIGSVSFLPNTLIEWLALFAIMLILAILGRSFYLSYKDKKGAHHHGSH